MGLLGWDCTWQQRPQLDPNTVPLVRVPRYRGGYGTAMPPLSSACVPGGKGGTDSETPTGFSRTALLLRLNPVRGIERGGVGDHTAAHGGDKMRLIGFRVASALRGEDGSSHGATARAIWTAPRPNADQVAVQAPPGARVTAGDRHT